MQTAIDESFAALDYPRANEVVTSPHYTLRISKSPKVEAVQISFDETNWQECRYSSGFYWYDWSGYMHGRHAVTLRAYMTDGSLVKTGPYAVRVELPSARK